MDRALVRDFCQQLDLSRDGRLTANAAAFYYDYDDIQINIYKWDPAVQQGVSRMQNAANALVKGAEFDDVSQTKAILALIAGSFGGYAVLVAIFVVASTLALTVEQRRREFALLRAVGATPRQIRKMIGAETLVVSTVAGVLGSALGIAVGHGLRDAFAAIGVVPPDFVLSISPIPLVAALLIGLAAARTIPRWAAWAMIASSPLIMLGFALRGVLGEDAGFWIAVGSTVLLVISALPAARALLTGSGSTASGSDAGARSGTAR